MSKKIITPIKNNFSQLEVKNNPAEELIVTSRKLALQIIEREKDANELIIANKELAFQNIEKEKRAAELIIANVELAYQNQEKEDRATELILAGKEMALQLIEKEKRAAELIIANIELAYQNEEKEKRAAELIIANKQLALEVIEKEKRAAELIIANIELAYQNKEKEDRAAELIIANKELAHQVIEKEKRAAELFIANKELEYQNKEKEKRAAELVIANKELAYQNIEKEKRAAELVIANQELAYQNIEKEKRAAELLIANKELQSFTYISSHDLQEPLRKIQAFTGRILDEEDNNLSTKGKYYLERTKISALHMQTLINDLLAYSRTNNSERKFEICNLNKIVREVMASLKEELQEKEAIIEFGELNQVNIIPFQFRQLLQNLISNSIKFYKPEVKPHIIITSTFVKYEPSCDNEYVLKLDYYHISIADNGIGFDPEFKHKVFDIFQRLHEKSTYEGTGIGLTIARKIVENHNGIITANAKINDGATFDIFIPA